MKRLVISEHGRLKRRGKQEPPPSTDGRIYLEGHLYDRLRHFDQAGRAESERVFRWEDGEARAQQWVGVIELPGLQLEILPKVDMVTTSRLETPESCHQVRSNLLTMLAIAGEIPVRSRELAHLESRKAPLSETLAAIYAKRLLSELLKGLDRAYLEREENLRQFKGKLAIPKHVSRNAAHRERFFCRYDELSEDTLMNRLFRAACLKLLATSRSPSTQESLRYCLLALEGVSDIVVHDDLFERVALSRQNERFADILSFSRLILSDRSPATQAGGTRSFSLLFDMNKVFERFLAAFLTKSVIPRIEGTRLFPQAKHHTRHLMTRNGRGVLPLRPDLLIEGPDGRKAVLDTKWKRLSPKGSGRSGVGVADLYQLFAYTRRYGSQRSVLLYPWIPGVSSQNFEILDPAGALSGEHVGVRFVKLNRDLRLASERQALAAELETLVLESLGGAA